MKKFTLLFAFAIATVVMSAQTLVSADFSDNEMPPPGWSIDGYVANWSVSSSAMAGGSAPEGKFTYSENDDVTRLIAPATDLTGYTSVSLTFKHFYDDYSGTGPKLGVATRSGGGDWTTAWEIDPTNDVGPEMLIISIENADVGASDFEFCFYLDGNFYNLDYWYVDDIALYIPYEHDVSTVQIYGDSYFDEGDTYECAAEIFNPGASTESFDVVCTIYDIDMNELFTDTQTVTDLAAETSVDVTFSGYTLPGADEVYIIEVSTDLDTDMNEDNNTQTKDIYTYTHDRNMVVLEIATGTWCVYCPGAAMGADDLVENDYNVAVVEYHVGDDYETVESAARAAYYGVGGYPTSYFDGVIAYVGGSADESIYSAYVPLVEQRDAIKVGVGCAMELTPTLDGYSVDVTYSKFAPVTSTSLVGQFVVTESHIPEVWFVMDEVDFVERLMLPDAGGTEIDLVNNDEVTITYNVVLDPSWDMNNLEVVAFIQDNATHEVLDGYKVSMNELVGVNELELGQDFGLAIYPNPVSDISTIQFNLKESSDVLIEVYNIQGQRVNQLANGNLAQGTHEIVWSVDSNVQNGIYFIKLQSGNDVITKKIFVSK
jgi:hypothetical protein